LLESLGHAVEEARPAFDAHATAKAFFLHFATGIASELALAAHHLGRPARREDVERETWLLALVGRAIDGGELVVQRRILLAAQRTIAHFFQGYDVLLTPTLGLPPQPHGALFAHGAEQWIQDAAARVATPALIRQLPSLVDRAVSRAYAFAPYTPLFNVTGQPSASVPIHWNDDGLPIGSMLTARFGEDETLLSLCAQIEAARPWKDRRPPIRA
jgi:amidase